MDWTNVAVLAIAALTPVVSMVAIWALKLAWSRIPAAWIFIVAPLVGILGNYLLSWLGNQAPANAILGAVLGLLAVVLREFLSTLQAKGINGPVSRTTGML